MLECRPLDVMSATWRPRTRMTNRPPHKYEFPRPSRRFPIQGAYSQRGFDSRCISTSGTKTARARWFSRRISAAERGRLTGAEKGLTNGTVRGSSCQKLMSIPVKCAIPRPTPAILSRSWAQVEARSLSERRQSTPSTRVIWPVSHGTPPLATGNKTWDGTRSGASQTARGKRPDTQTVSACPSQAYRAPASPSKSLANPRTVHGDSSSVNWRPTR